MPKVCLDNVHQTNRIPTLKHVVEAGLDTSAFEYSCCKFNLSSKSSMSACQDLDDGAFNPFLKAESELTSDEN
jgi:hypothetical protein